ncbi:acyl-CoA oxidase-like protein [Naegleria gruberi]|uniref:acyl-CoA oxidase n=1 Tax=Naegleria gruberi TaxID=5762 RepID=D2VSE9_NAEGR|nr:acyl-CoA oxidase-like protein [Naegleria gruberi]EFC40106.1 acyl-CoA oxidase-like protein [Naegleria gruberi]|eukprot:XP_002672850.1 acyl-CoA oxidase-like protein [Naegleria gruberi strain NEG-M]
MHEARRLSILLNHLNIHVDQEQQQNSLSSNSCSSSSSSKQQQIIYNIPSNASDLNFKGDDHHLELPADESLHRYHLMLKRKDQPLYDQLPTKSLSSLKAFHSKDCKSLASRLLQTAEKTIFDKGYTAAREAVWKILNQETFTIDNEWQDQQLRLQIVSQFREFIKNKPITTQVMNENIFFFLGALESAIQYDTSFTAALVVSMQLFGTCIYKLGTGRHQYLLNDLNSGRDIGSFCMTELTHGSNTRAIETTAHYDHDKKEFIINSPSESSYKYWIGNTAFFGTKTCVFAQLYVNNENKGVHVFVVPIRDQDTLDMYPGITIKDIGSKNGWRGVANGCLRFDHVRIPASALLNKYGDIDTSGNYTSQIKDENVRFALTLAALSMGRLLYIAGPTFALRAGLTTAIRYAHQRRQFGGKDGKENLIWEYPTHLNMMLPMVAISHAFHSGMVTLAHEWASVNNSNMEDFHAVVSGIKAYVCEYVTPALRELRVACGGHGYSSNNRINILMNDMDVFNTAEGDATVLYIQVAKFLLGKASKKANNNPVLKLVLSAEPKAAQNVNLLTFENQAKALAFRVKSLLEKCSTSIAKHMKDKKDAQTAFNLALVDVIELARSYIELEMLFRLDKSLIKNAADEQVKQVFKTLSDIYALTIIKQNLSYYLVYQYFDIDTSKKVMDDILPHLYQTVNPDILEIVDSFNIPDSLLRAPLGLSNNQSYVKRTLQSIGFKAPTIE